MVSLFVSLLHNKEMPMLELIVLLSLRQLQYNLFYDCYLYDGAAGWLAFYPLRLLHELEYFRPVIQLENHLLSSI